MIIYLISLAWIILCGFLFRNKYILFKWGNTKIECKAFFAYIATSLLIFFIGLRSAGADTEAYIASFNNANVGFDNMISAFSNEEGLFDAFSIFIKTYFSSNYHAYLFLIALISGFAVTITFFRYSEYFTSTMVLFVLTGTYTWMINGIRQFLASSLAFAATPLLLKRKTSLYLLIIWILSGIHNSVLIMIPIYFLVIGKPFEKKTLVMLAIAIFAILFTKDFTSILDSALEYTSYAGIINGKMYQENNGSNILRTMIFLVPIVLAILEKEKIQNDAPPIIKLSINMSIICVCFSLIANVTSGIYFGRLPMYFSLYNLILLPWLVYNSKLIRNRYILPILMFVCYGFYFYLDGRIYYYSDLLFNGKIFPR